MWLFGDVENDVPFPEDLLDLSGTWDMEMQTQPHFLNPQGVDEVSPTPDKMMGVDLPTGGTLLPLRDVSMAEMPPNVTVTHKRKRSKQHASLGHLTKVMGTVNGPDTPPVHPSAAGSQEAEPGPVPRPRMHSRARLHPSEKTAAGPPIQPLPKRQRSDRPPRQLHERFFPKQPRPGPTARLRAADRPAEAAAAAPAPAAPALKRRRSEGASEGRPAAEEEPQPPQRELRRRGRMPERLAALLENERSPGSEDSGEEGERSGSHQGAGPSAVTGCRLSKAACRAQGALHQLSNEEVMEAEAELSPDATEEEREAAYRRVKSRSAARKTRRRKAETIKELQEQMQVSGKQNRNLISQLNKLLIQVQRYSRENAQLKRLLQYLESEGESSGKRPSLTNFEAFRNDMVPS
ncbi:hypothetical protein COCOBI_18-0320 [Coccomyxa sp. Obi]|nr:hypothetical protein COCOBI_18-0320 [Coccomyxa sp. Obi]